MHLNNTQVKCSYNFINNNNKNFINDKLQGYDNNLFNRNVIFDGHSMASWVSRIVSYFFFCY